jgi:SAM-dependent methyltransferase
MKSTMQTKNLEKWLLQSDSGRHILSLERVFYHKTVARIFGYYALQLGLANIDYLHGNKINNKYIINQTLKSDLYFLPFADNSIDLIICPHILECTSNYHYLLQECYRILIPGGTMLISAFSHSALFKPLFSYKPEFNSIKFINLEILKAQLHTLNFSISGGSFLSYTPPIEWRNLTTKLSFLEQAGNRWLPSLANIFTLTITKLVIPQNLSPAHQAKNILITQQQLGTNPACKIIQ